MLRSALVWLGFSQPEGALAGGSAHGHDHGHGGHGHGGKHGHTHGVVDPTIATTARGIWAIKWSFVILAITASLQLAVVFATGSVALLADSIHNIGDAVTAIPLWIAFRLVRMTHAVRISPPARPKVSRWAVSTETAATGRLRRNTPIVADPPLSHLWGRASRMNSAATSHVTMPRPTSRTWRDSITDLPGPVRDAHHGLDIRCRERGEFATRILIIESDQESSRVTKNLNSSRNLLRLRARASMIARR